METFPVPQEHPMGCAVACVAFRAGLTYREAHAHFAQQRHAWTRGYYCSEIIDALSKMGLHYIYSHFNKNEHRQLLRQPGTIIFIRPSSKFPNGHFLIKAVQGWMNPWANFPLMLNLKAEFEDKIPGGIDYIIWQTSLNEES